MTKGFSHGEVARLPWNFGHKSSNGGTQYDTNNHDRYSVPGTLFGHLGEVKELELREEKKQETKPMGARKNRISGEQTYLLLFGVVLSDEEVGQSTFLRLFLAYPGTPAWIPLETLSESFLTHDCVSFHFCSAHHCSTFHASTLPHRTTSSVPSSARSLPNPSTSEIPL